VNGAARAGDKARATFRDVFSTTEFAALWTAQLLSVTGDQLARVALTVLVYDRTRSALLAAITFAASTVPAFVGSVTLSWIADRLPRRRVMMGADLISGMLVVVMAVPGVPLAALIVLLAAVTTAGAVFLAARAAVYPDILHGDRYVLGTAVTMTTYQFAQVVGFAAGGFAVAFLGLRVSLLTDAATFAASALIIRAWLHARPAAAPVRAARLSPENRPPSGAQEQAPARPAGTVAGLRLVFGNPAMRTAMLFGWLCAFYNIPEGVATPLASAVGGGAVTVGLILAALAFGSTVGALGFSRFVAPAQRVKWTGPLAVAACATLVLFAARPGLAGVLVILALAGLFGCYQLAANSSFVQATPSAWRSQAFGIAQGGINLGQGTAVVLAGAAAEHYTPASVISATGGIGALCALAIAFSKPARRYWRGPAQNAEAVRVIDGSPDRSG
jgi:predicted MFS family arabinose efflux permease